MFSFLWQAENIQDSLLSYDLPKQKVENLKYQILNWNHFPHKVEN